MVKPVYKRTRDGTFEFFGAYMHEYGKNKVSQRIGIHAKTEDDDSASEVTQYAIEKGEPITDHSRPTSKTITLSILIQEDTMAKANKVWAKLNKWRFDGTQVVFKGAVVYYKHLQIEDLTRHGEKYTSTIEATMSLKFVHFAKTSRIKKKGKKSNGNKKPTGSTKSAQTKGTYRKTKAGDTYWGFHQSFGTSIATLRKWNKYPDRKIPIGVRVRVK